jgi:hypothetical protein
MTSGITLCLCIGMEPTMLLVLTPPAEILEFGFRGLNNECTYPKFTAHLIAAGVGDRCEEDGDGMILNYICREKVVSDGRDSTVHVRRHCVYMERERQPEWDLDARDSLLMVKLTGPIIKELILILFYDTPYNLPI